MGFIINPYQFGVPFTGLLDTYSGAATAYSAARRLSSTYTGSLIRVRRSSDNTEQDIGYDSNNVLDESALTTFVGAGNGFITTWYDQSGNALNESQSTASNQPQIVSSGTVIKQDSKPAIQFDVNKFLRNLTLNNLAQPNSYSIVTTLPTESFGFIFDSNALFRQTFLRNSSQNNIYMDSGAALIGTSGNVTSGNRYLFSLLYNGSSSNAYVNNALELSGNAGTSRIVDLYIGSRYDQSVWSGMKMQEFIMWNSDQSSNRSGINSNTNTFYSIY